MIPESYKPASWRNTTPVDKSKEAIGIGFNTQDNGIIRLNLDIKSARHLIETLTESISAHKTGAKMPENPAQPRIEDPALYQLIEKLHSPEVRAEIIDIITDAINSGRPDLIRIENSSSGKYRLTARVISEQHLKPTTIVPVRFIRDVLYSLISLKLYIDQMPPHNPVVWIGDKTTLVSDLPDYLYAEKAIKAAEKILEQFKNQNNETE